MMDGNPAGSEQQWLSEVNQYQDSYNDIMSESYRSLNAKIDGLFVAKDDNVSPATYKSLLDLRDNVGGASLLLWLELRFLNRWKKSLVPS